VLKFGYATRPVNFIDGSYQVMACPQNGSRDLIGGTFGERLIWHERKRNAGGGAKAAGQPDDGG
jgi:hypothetical protein